MPIFITILEGPNAAEARPILASRDKRLIAVVAAELARRFDLPEGPTNLVSVNRKLRQDGPKLTDTEPAPSPEAG